MKLYFIDSNSFNFKSKTEKKYIFLIKAQYLIKAIYNLGKTFTIKPTNVINSIISIHERVTRSTPKKTTFLL